ncbi:MAG: alpha/beta hydrolase [Caldilineaceae bacterium]
MQQVINDTTTTVFGERQQRIWLWWLGALGAILALLKCYSIYSVQRAKAKVPAIGEFVCVEGVRLHYLRRGTGQPVVLLHGSALTLQDFQASILDQVAASYAAIAFDRPGYGYSEWPQGEPLTLALNARLLHGALQQLAVEKPILLGHSAGTSVALHYALTYPDAVAGLVLIAPNAYAAEQPIPPLFLLTEPPVLGKLFLHTLLAPFAQIAAPRFAAGLFAPNSPPAGFVTMLKAFTVRPRHFRTLANELKHLQADLRAQSARYGEIALPVTIIDGTNDQIDQPENQAIPLQKALPNAQLVTVTGSGHTVHHENPGLVLAALQHVQRRT